MLWIRKFFFIENVFQKLILLPYHEVKLRARLHSCAKAIYFFRVYWKLAKIIVRNLSILTIKFCKRGKVFFLWRRKLIIIYFSNSFKIFFYPHFNHTEGRNHLFWFFFQNKVTSIHETFKVSLVNILPEFFRNCNEFELFFSLTETPETCYRCYIWFWMKINHQSIWCSKLGFSLHFRNVSNSGFQIPKLKEKENLPCVLGNFCKIQYCHLENNIQNPDVQSSEQHVFYTFSNIKKKNIAVMTLKCLLNFSIFVYFCFLAHSALQRLSEVLLKNKSYQNALPKWLRNICSTKICVFQ